MQKRIVIPLYDHATAPEIREILDELARLGLSLDPVYEERVGSGWYETDPEDGRPIERSTSRRADRPDVRPAS